MLGFCIEALRSANEPPRLTFRVILRFLANQFPIKQEIIDRIPAAFSRKKIVYYAGALNLLIRTHRAARKQRARYWNFRQLAISFPQMVFFCLTLAIPLDGNL